MSHFGASLGESRRKHWALRGAAAFTVAPQAKRPPATVLSLRFPPDGRIELPLCCQFARRRPLLTPPLVTPSNQQRCLTSYHLLRRGMHARRFQAAQMNGAGMGSRPPRPCRHRPGGFTGGFCGFGSAAKATDLNLVAGVSLAPGRRTAEPSEQPDRTWGLRDYPRSAPMWSRYHATVRSNPSCKPIFDVQPNCASFETSRSFC